MRKHLRFKLSVKEPLLSHMTLRSKLWIKRMITQFISFIGMSFLSKFGLRRVCKGTETYQTAKMELFV